MFDSVCRDVYRGEKLALQVLDRVQARRCSHDEAYAFISITDLGVTHPRLLSSPHCRGVLQLHFSDVDERVATIKGPSSYFAAFTEEMAQAIADFVRAQVAEGVGLIVVNCEAGMSRSAGIAAAISAFYNRDEFFFLTHYRPNTFVRGLVLAAFAHSSDASEKITHAP